MATMNRNVNLEEINSDAFMGIPFLNHQTIGQKVIFWGSVVVAVIWNILGTFLFHINAGIIIALTLVLLAFGVAFGCNYNQDLSLLEYLKLILFKPATAYYTKPVEDLEQIKIAAARMDKEAELLEKQKEVTPEQQRKLLIRLLSGVLIVVLLFVIFLIVLIASKEDVLHHVI